MNKFAGQLSNFFRQENYYAAGQTPGGIKNVDIIRKFPLPITRKGGFIQLENNFDFSTFHCQSAVGKCMNLGLIRSEGNE